MVQATKPVEKVVQAIQALDLDPIKVKLMDAEEGQGWSREYTDRMELAYKRFLTLLVKYPHETIAPTKDVDKFWHGHILDTMKYAEDCEQTFGYFLHHFPYFGMRGEDDSADLRAAAERMNALYDQEFNAPATDAAWCVAAKPAASSEAAWCVAARPEKTDSAWCVAARPAKADSAWCVAARPEKADSAWCVAAQPSGKSGAAWCVAAKPVPASAWCVAGKSAAQLSTAWCVASGQVDVTTRPTLAPAS